MSAYKVLGQVNPTTTGTLTALYAVPASTQAFCSTLSICNQGSTTSSARVAVQPSGTGILPNIIFCMIQLFSHRTLYS